MGKIKPFKKVKANYTSISFCSIAKYNYLIKNNKVERNTVYFIDDSINDMVGVSNEN